MSRSSFSTGIFSPIRYDMSFNESLLSDGASDRGSISDALKMPESVESEEDSVNAMHLLRQGKTSNMRNKSPYNLHASADTVFRTSSDKNCGGKTCIAVTEKETVISKQKSEEFLSSLAQENKTPLTIPEDKEGHKKKSYQDVGKTDRDKNKNLNRGTRSSANSVSSSCTSNRSKNRQATKFVTIRNQKDNPTGKCDSKITADLLPTYQEYSDESKLASMPSDSSNTGKTIIDSLVYNSKDSNETDFNSVLDPQHIAGIHAEKKLLPHTASSDSTARLPNQPTHIHATVIEKLITSNVSYEMDSIRQQMYHQTWALCKAINDRMDEFEEKYAMQNLNLCKIIEELIIENKQLRNALIVQ